MNLLERLKSFYGSQDVTPVDGQLDIYRCIKKTASGIPYQIVYVDLTNSWLTIDFSGNLDHFLVTDYYANAGYLQWNFYYYFISSSELIYANLQKKNEIENNESYARKFVMESNEFSSWLSSIEEVGGPEINELSNDLFSTWIEYLRQNKLFFVFDDANYPNYARWVDAYIDGQEFADSNEIGSLSANAIDGIGLVSELRIHSFRERPEGQPFCFGIVNLIHGPNASGKSSLLQAIELVITGESKSLVQPGYNLEFTNTTGVSFKYPDDYAVYKKRDVAWYKSAMTKGHHLNDNFNKFNYYASDAAYILKMNSEAGKYDLEEIISDIALGREVNRLEERITEFKDRFGAASGKFQAEEQNVSHDLAQKREQLDVLKNEVGDAREYKVPLVDKLHKLGWKDLLFTGPAKDELVNIENALQVVGVSLSTIVNIFASAPQATYEEVQSEIRVIEGRLQVLNKQTSLITSLMQRRNMVLERIDELVLAAEALKGLQQICAHPQFNALIGLERNISDITRKIEGLADLVALSREIAYSGRDQYDSYKGKALNEIETEINRKIQVDSDEVAEVKRQKDQLESSINELSKIIASIKSEGIKFVQLETDADYCPLCNTNFRHQELLDAITRSRDTFAQSKSLIDINQRIFTLDLAVQVNKLLAEHFIKVKTLGARLFNNEWHNKTYDELSESIHSTESELDLCNETLVELRALQFTFRKDNVSEGQVKELQGKLLRWLNIEVGDLSTCRFQLNEVENKIATLQEERHSLDEDINQCDQVIRSDGLNAMYPDESTLINNLAIYKNLEMNYRQLTAYIDLTSENNPFTIYNEFSSLQGLFEVYRRVFNEAKNNNQTIEYIQADIADILAKLEVLNVKKTRASRGLNLLNDLLIQHDKIVFLHGYIESNKAEISDIFKMIHSPVEFTEIEVVDSRIRLKPTRGLSRGLDEISTGQRSALALSVFLTLNKKLTSGPKLILFDDPVTYVDDLNALSFLDYLREIVLQNNRQIFFATANADLAFLFRKKFQCLGQQAFVEIKLQRVEQLTI